MICPLVEGDCVTIDPQGSMGAYEPNMANSFEDGLVIFLIVKDDRIFHKILLEPVVQISC